MVGMMDGFATEIPEDTPKGQGEPMVRHPWVKPAGIVAAAAIIVGGGVLGVIALGGDDGPGPSASTGPTPTMSVTTSAHPTPTISPTVAEITSIQTAPGSCTDTFDCIAGLEHTPEGIISEVGPGWAFSTMSDADFESYGGPLPDGGHQALFLTSPDGVTYRLADLDPSVQLGPVAWDADTSRLIVSYPDGSYEGDILYSNLALDPLTGIGEAFEYPPDVDRTSPCGDCSYVKPSSDGGEVWIALTGWSTAEITVVDADGTPHTYPYEIPEEVGHAIVWPIFDPSGRWAILEETLTVSGATNDQLLDVPLRVMDFSTGEIRELIDPDGPWPVCIHIVWADPTTFWCWQAKPSFYTGTGSHPSTGLSLVDIETGAETVLATWRAGDARIGSGYGVTLDGGYLNWNDPWRGDASPNLYFATKTGAIAEIDLAGVFSTAPSPIVDTDLSVTRIDGEWVIIQARSASMSRAASLYNPVTGEVIEILGWRDASEGGMIGWTVAE
jgi:hypothetical protein